MKIVAHRGASGSEKENTLSAFEAAYEGRADAIETDLRRCPFCWQLKLSHDPIASEEECGELVDFSRILEFGKKIELIIELKEKGVVKEAAVIAENLRWRDKITFSSFLWLELWKAKKINPRARIGILWDKSARNIPKSLTALAGVLVGASGIHLDLEMLKRDASLLRYFQGCGFPVYAYTVNSEADILLAQRLNLDGIFTDYPAYASYIIFGKTGD